MHTPIEYDFDPKKTIAAMAFFVRKLGPLNKVKLMKLMYLADRAAFLRLGHPITGSGQFALPHGPVPSESLNLLNESLPEDDLFQHLHIVDNQVRLKEGENDAPGLDENEIAILEETAREFGAVEQWTLVHRLHDEPEVKEVYVPKSSRPIPYEIILKHHGNQRQFSDGRPVITAAMAKHIKCPFPPADPDL